MKKIRIFFGYKHTEAPWGGANNFIRALYNGINNHSDFIAHHDVNTESDILFFGQLSYGPGNVEAGSKKLYCLSEIKRLKNKSKAPLVVRAVNLNINSDKLSIFGLLLYIKNGLLQDINTIRLVNFADFVIFQSEFQKSFFKKWGYTGKKNTVIHNGAPLIFKNEKFLVNAQHSPLRIVSNSHHKAFKRHEIIAEMSLLEGVNIIHLGNWSDKIPRQNVEVRGTVSHAEMVEIYKNSDYLLHPAILDPCPNAIIEALYFGLPVIYSGKEGSSGELVKANGIMIDEGNLEETIGRAKKDYVSLKEKLSGERDYYSINRAISQYEEVFNKLREDHGN